MSSRHREAISSSSVTTVPSPRSRISRTARPTRSASWCTRDGGEASWPLSQMKDQRSDEGLHLPRELLLRHALRRGPHDEATRGVALEGAEHILQAVALGPRDLARDGHVVEEGHEDEVVPRQGDVGGQARALGAHGLLDDLHEDPLPLVEVLHRGALAVDDLPRLLLQEADGPHVALVEEAVPLQAHVHEGALHPRQDPVHAAHVEVSHQAVQVRSARGSTPRAARPQ